MRRTLIALLPPSPSAPAAATTSRATRATPGRPGDPDRDNRDNRHDHDLRGAAVRARGRSAPASTGRPQRDREPREPGRRGVPLVVNSGGAGVLYGFRRVRRPLRQVEGPGLRGQLGPEDRGDGRHRAGLLPGKTRRSRTRRPPAKVRRCAGRGAAPPRPGGISQPARDLDAYAAPATEGLALMMRFSANILDVREDGHRGAQAMELLGELDAASAPALRERLAEVATARQRPARDRPEPPRLHRPHPA